MKMFIRTNWYYNEDERARDKEELNRLGFYCLDTAFLGLDVYVLEERKLCLFDRFLKFVNLI